MQAPTAPPPTCPPQQQRLGRGTAASHAPPCAPKGDGCLLQPGVRGAELCRSRAALLGEELQRGWTGRHLSGAEARASATGAAGEQAPKGLGGAGAIPSAATCNPIASVIQATSSVPSRTATQGHDGQALGMLKGVMWQPDRHAVCPTPPSTRFVLRQLPRQTLPRVQNFLSFSTRSVLGSRCGFRQY